MELILFIIGIVSVIAYYLFRNANLKHSYIILNSAEDQKIIVFIISNLGLWFLFTAVFFLLKNRIVTHFSFNLIIGPVIGFIIGLRSLFFWISESNSVRSRPEEAIGSVGIGCFGLLFHIVIGLILVIVL